MKSILDRLYAGEMNPSEEIACTSPEYQLLVRQIDQEQEYISEKLDTADRIRLDRLGQLYMDEGTMTGYAGFLYGLRLGVRLIGEIFARDQD